MAKLSLKVDTVEARIIAIHRAVIKLSKTSEFVRELVSPAECGSLLEGLQEAVDLQSLESDSDFTAAEMRALIEGFISGIAASRAAALAAEGMYLEDPSTEEEAVEEEDFSGEDVAGGPSNGIVAGQLTGDPRYVRQSGVRAEESQ